MERGMNERIRKLRKQSLETEPHIYMERAKLETEAYMMYEGVYLFRSCVRWRLSILWNTKRYVSMTVN